jgi:Bacterial pre-peptidase C-terminal domain
MDPALTWQVQSTGPHVLQVFGFAYPADSDIRFSGNARSVYRLQVSTGPMAHHLWPLGVERGRAQEREVRGWNLTPDTRRLTVDATGPSTNGWISVSLPGTETSWDVPVGEGRELVEVEPNTKSAEAQSLEPPVGISGEASLPGDEDRYRFNAKMGDRFVFEVQAVRLGFGWDAWLAVESADGKEVTRVDDAAGADPRLEWTAPEDGTYVVAVGNLLQRGSPESFYRLALTPARPDVRLTVPDSAFTLTAGQTNEVKVTVNRLQGYAGKLSVQAVGLPDGVSTTPVDVAESAGEAVLRWVASTNAAPTNVVVRIEATDLATAQVRVAAQDLVSAGENNGVPQGYRRLVRESVSDLWLTVLPVPTPKEEKPAEEKK